MKSAIPTIAALALACGTSSGTPLAEPVAIERTVIELTPERLLPPETTVLMTFDMDRIQQSAYIDSSSTLMMAWRLTPGAPTTNDDLPAPWEGVRRLTIVYVDDAPDHNGPAHADAIAPPASPNMTEALPEEPEQLRERLFAFAESTRSARELYRVEQERRARRAQASEAEAPGEAEESGNRGLFEEGVCEDVNAFDLFGDAAGVLHMSEGLRCGALIAVSLEGRYIVVGTNLRLRTEFARLVNPNSPLAEFPRGDAARLAATMPQDAMVSLVGEQPVFADDAPGATGFVGTLNFTNNVDLALVGSWETESQGAAALELVRGFRNHWRAIAAVFASTVDVTPEFDAIQIAQEQRDVSVSLHVPAARMLEIMQQVNAMRTNSATGASTTSSQSGGGNGTSGSTSGGTGGGMGGGVSSAP